MRNSCFFTEPPVFSSFPPVVETLKNAEVSIECELSGTPPFDVVWYKDKRQLRSSKKYKIVSKISMRAFTFLVLTLQTWVNTTVKHRTKWEAILAFAL